MKIYKDSIIKTALFLVLIAILFIGPYQLSKLHASGSSTEFTDKEGNKLVDISIGDDLFVSVEDEDENKDINAKESISVTITSTSGDSEIKTLVETGNNTGIFRNIAGLPTGLYDESCEDNDGKLEIKRGGSIAARYQDPDTSSSKTYLPSLIYEGGHVDDGNGANDPSGRNYHYVQDFPPLTVDIEGTASCHHDNYLTSYPDTVGITTKDISLWNPNDTTNGGYIPKDRNQWDFLDKGQGYIPIFFLLLPTILQLILHQMME